MTTDTAVNALSLALSAARAEGRTVRSIKDLLCDACGAAAAMREGLCHRCNDEAAAHYAARSAEVLPAVMLSQVEPDGFALDCAAAYDDAEAAAALAGTMPGKH